MSVFPPGRRTRQIFRWPIYTAIPFEQFSECAPQIRHEGRPWESRPHAAASGRICSLPSPDRACGLGGGLGPPYYNRFFRLRRMLVGSALSTTNQVKFRQRARPAAGPRGGRPKGPTCREPLEIDYRDVQGSSLFRSDHQRSGHFFFAATSAARHYERIFRQDRARTARRRTGFMP